MSEEEKRKLENLLWGIANLLRGKISADDYRDYIPRYVDTFEEEEPIDLNEVAERLIAIDDELIKTNNEIVGFCDELDIVPPFKVEVQP
jgi:type I restriction enzyme M protein